LVIRRTNKSFVDIAASSSSPANRGTIGMARAQAVTLRGGPTTACRHVAAPRDLPPLHMAYDEHDRKVSHINGFA